MIYRPRHVPYPGQVYRLRQTVHANTRPKTAIQTSEGMEGLLERKWGGKHLWERSIKGRKVSSRLKKGESSESKGQHDGRRKDRNEASCEARGYGSMKHETGRSNADSALAGYQSRAPSRIGDHFVTGHKSPVKFAVKWWPMGWEAHGEPWQYGSMGFCAFF